MIRKKMEREEFQTEVTGNRCNICTGCGRCVGSVYVENAADIIHLTDKTKYNGGDEYGNERQNDRQSGRQPMALHILTAAGLEKKQISLINSMFRRLVTVDIGTTTIAMQLYDRHGAVADEFVCVNPQTAYGADVMSRIHASWDPKKALDMQADVQAVLRQGYDRFQAHLEDGESLFAVLAGNTTMIYLLLGYEARELGEYPFRVSHPEAVHKDIASVETMIFPGLSAFVGGDIAAGLYACGMEEREAYTLFIDLGTNGEIVLGNREGISCCGTAAGPAFEGGPNRGIWGSDMMALLARLLQEGIVDETGLLSEAYFDSGIRIGDVLVTQQSIRAIQLAKAAVAAGVRILLEKKGLSWGAVDEVILAGGFGYYLKPQDALKLGLFGSMADCGKFPEPKMVSGGNTALLGAYRLGAELLNGKRNVSEITGIKNLLPGVGIETVNLAQIPEFNEIYLSEMNFCG